MSKLVKMILYAEPGTGKSTFASKMPAPFFFCSDGNYEWLGLPDEDHCQLNSWSQAVQKFDEIPTAKYAQYKTIVIDLLDTLYVWSEKEFCKNHGLEYIGDMGHGKGYDMVRKSFLLTICKLIKTCNDCGKHIIILSHAIMKEETDVNDKVVCKYYPSDRISYEKIWLPLSGEVTFALRAYIKHDVDKRTGTLKKTRWLSIVPKANEFGVTRCIDEENTPYDIPLDWETFAAVVGLDKEPAKKVVKPVAEHKVEPAVQTVVKPTVKVVEPKVEVVEPEVVIPSYEEVVANPKAAPLPESILPEVESPVQAEFEPKFEAPQEDVINQLLNSKPVEPTPVVVAQPKVEPTPVVETSNEDKMAAIRARIAAMKNKA